MLRVAVPRQRCAGFSMIEVAITLALFGLLLALGLPSFQGWLQNTQIRNAAESVSAGVQRARNEAVRRNQNVRFTLVSLSNPKSMDNTCAASASAGSWVISLDDPATKCAAAPSDTTAPRIVDKRAAGDGSLSATVAAVATDNSAASTVTFNGFGRTVDAKPLARVDVTSAASGNYRTLRVLVSSGGAVRMCDPAVTDAADPRKCP
jgi:type IV fimbrial biogenesis protein FimT